MGLSTYSELKASIADHLDRDDLTTQIDDFIDLAEVRHKRDIRIREMINRSTVTLGTTDRFLALPSDFLQMQVLRITEDADGNELQDNLIHEVNLYEMTRLRLKETARPRFFTIHEEIEFDTTPDQAYGAEMVYYAQLTALSDSNTTNAILVRAPDAYLYGALVASAPFLMHDERIQIWGDLYVATRNDLNRDELNARHSGPLVSRIDGITP